MAEAKTDKKQALELAIATIERQFGKGSVMRLGANGPLEEIAVIPTGALSLDVALGVGGVPRGRVVEIYGPESSGKTTLALHVVSEAQRLGGIAAFIDAEHALDPIYAKKLGVNTDELLISQPDTGEQALEITETLVRSNAVDVIVIDSVAALVPRAELDGAGWWSRLRFVTLPTISPVILFAVVIGVIEGLQYFTQAYVAASVAGGSATYSAEQANALGYPQDSTLFYPVLLYQHGFTDFQMGYASAMSVLLLVVSFAITLVIVLNSRRWVYQAAPR